MANPRIKLKRSNVLGRVPTDSDLEFGELALNYRDGKLYFKNANLDIVAFIDSGRIQSLIDNIDQLAQSQLDSNEIFALVDNDYINSRLDSSLYLDSAEVIALIDSDYINLRLDLNTILDSAEIKDLIDSDYIRSAIDEVFTNSFTIDAETLNGESASYYLDYNNFTNTPVQLDSDIVKRFTVDSAEVVDLVDSTYVQARIDATYINSLTIDADTLGGQNPAHYLAYGNLTGTPTILDNTDVRNLIDSDHVQLRQTSYNTSDFLDSDTVSLVVDSAYVQARQITYNTSDFTDSAYVTGLPVSTFTNDANYLDSAEAIALIDSAYVQARQVDLQRDSGFITDIIDSAYISDRSVGGMGFDSADIENIVDSDYVQARIDSDFLRTTGGTLTGHLNIDGTNKIYFNDSNGFIGYTGALLNIRQNNASLRLTNNSFQLVNTSSLGLITADENSVGLRYAGNTKLQTETGGVTVTGTLNDHTLPGGTGGTYALTSDIPSFGTDFIDSDTVEDIVDSAYVQLRQTAQDFSYTSLTNVPDLFDSSDAETLVDSAYVQARQIQYNTSDFLDSTTVEGVVDSAYVRQRVKTDQDLLTTSDVTFNSVTSDLNGAIEFTAKNAEGSTLTKGTVVYINGVSGNNATVAKADASDPTKMPAFGIVAEDANNNANAIVFTFGTLYDLATDSFEAGDTLFVSDTPGRLTNVKPAGEGNLLQNIGRVIRSHASAGSIKVGGAGRTNATPNLDNDQFFLGNDSNYAVATDFATAIAEVVDSAFVKERVNTDQDLATTDSVTFSGLTVSGDFTVTGTTKEVNTIVYTINDPLIHLADSNEQSDVVDIGHIGHYYRNGQRRHTGIFRDASNEEYYIFNNMVDSAFDSTLPPNTINRSATDFTLSTVNVGTLVGVYAGFDSDFTAKSTSDLSEGTNLYYTQSRVDSSIDTRVTASFINLLNVDADTLDGQDGTYYLNYNNFTNTPTIPALSTDFVDSAEALKLIDANALDSGRATSLIDSAYVNLRADHYTGFDSDFTAKSTTDLSEGTNLYYTKTRVDSDIAAAFDDSAGGVNVTINNFVEDKVDSDYVLARVDEAPFLDSTDAINLIDSDYVQLRQDYAYGSLTGAPVVFDSEMVDAIIDSNLFNGHGVRNVVINENNTTPTTNDGDVVAIGYDVAKGTGAKFRRSVIVGARSQNTDYNTLFNIHADANVVIGTYSAAESDATAIGHSTEAAVRSVVIGQDNGSITSNDSAVVLIGGGNNNQGPRSVAIGYRAGFFNRGEHNVLVGYSAGSVSDQDDGYFGVADQGNRNVILGYDAFGNNGDNKIIIGHKAGGHNMGGIDSQTGNYIALGDSDINRLIIPGLGIDTEKADSGQTLIWDNTAGQFYFGANGQTYNTSDFADSAYVQSVLPVLYTDFIDSAEAIKLITANAIDSGVALQLLLDSIETIALIDSDYIRLRTRIGDSDIDFGSHKILYSNVYSAEGDLPDANTYHGMFAHVHATGAGYFAHAGNWVRLANQSEIFDGTYASLTGKPDFFDSNDATILIDSAYVQARTTAGTDSAATIALIEATVDSAYVQLREAAGGGGGGDGGVDSAATISLIQSTVDSAYVLARVDSDYEKHINQIVYLFTADSGQTAFVDSDDNGQVLSFTNAQQLTVFLNGILLTGTSDVTTNASTNTITLTEAADSGDVLSVIKLSGAKPHIDSDMINSISLKHVTYVYTADSGQTAFTGADDNSQTLALADNSRVSLNGILLLDTVDYTATGTTVTLVTAADSGDILTVEKFQGRDAALDSSLINNVAMSFTQYVYTADSGDTTFSGADDNGLTLAYTANRVRVHINGILQVDSADYTATNGTSVVLTEAADSGDVIQIEKFAGRDVGLDSGDITLLIDSAYVAARTTAGTDSSTVSSIIETDVDSAYVQLRQDFAYASLTGTPTIPALHTDFIDSAAAIRLITANAIDSGVALQLLLDSIETIALIDSAYVNNRLDFSNTSANEIIAMNANNNGFVASGMIYNSSTQSLGIGVDSAGSIDARLHIVGTGTPNTGETLFKVNNNDDHDRIEFIDENTSASMPSALRIKLPTEGMGIIAENGPVRIFQGGSTTSDTVARFHADGITFNGEYTFPNTDGSANQVLQTDGSGQLSFAAGGLDSALTTQLIDSDYVRLKVLPTISFGSNDSATISNLQVTNQLSLGGSGSQFFAYNEDTVKVKFANWYSSNDRQYGMGQLWYETWIGAVDEYNLGPTQRRIGFYLETPDAGASDADGAAAAHPSNARMYINDSGMHVNYANPIRLNESGGDNYIELAGAQTLSSNVTLTLPTTTGTLALISDIDSDYIKLHTRIGDSDIDFGSNKILYSNVYSTEGDLPSATTYHGMFAHVHGTGAGYFAHAGNWVRLANQSEIFDGAYSSLTGTPALIDSALTIQLIDSAYVQARTTAGTDSAATIALIEATVDSAYVALREANSGGGSGLDSSAIIALIDSDYVAAREADAGVGGGGVDSAATQAMIDSSITSKISQLNTFENNVTTFTADSGQSEFTGLNVLTDNTAVYLNGILLTKTEDYTITSNAVTLVEAADSGYTLTVVEQKGKVGTHTFATTKFEFTADSGQVTFTGADDNSAILAFDANVGHIQVFLNGILLSETNDYTLSGGDTVTLVDSADSADFLTLVQTKGNITSPEIDTFEFTADSGQTVFTGADDNSNTLAYASGAVQVHVNGILLRAADYTSTSGTSITLTEAADSGDDILISAFAPQGTYLEKYKFTADSGQTVFTGADLAGNNLVYQIGNTQVFLNGLLLPDSDFTASSGTSITLGTATDVNDELMIHSFSRATTSAPITVTSKSDWQEQTQSVSVDANTRNIIDCSGGAITITFPSSPALGDEIRIIDGTGNAATNNITINRNGNKIQGVTDNFIIDVDRAAIGFVYYNAAQGWILIEN